MNAPFLISMATGSGKTASGILFLMRCMPDPFTGEILNVGVCASDDSGRRLCKVVTEPSRLKCLYGDDSRNVLMLAEMGKQAFLAGTPSPSSQIIFDEPLPFFNSSLEDAVDSAFKGQVTVAFPLREARDKSKMTDEDLWLKVSNEVKNSVGLDAHFLAQSPQVIINTDRGPRPIYAPIQTANGAGVVRSAFYDQATVKMHLMDSVLDLECAARYRSKSRLGLFILRPAKASEARQAAIDNVIDSIAFRSPKELHIEVKTEVEDLAKDIIEWSEH